MSTNSSFAVQIEESMLQRLRDLLAMEDEGSCVRLREYKIGGGWHSKIALGLGIDELDTEEDEQISIDDITFIAEKDFLLKYGRDFSLVFSEEKGTEVIPLSA